MLIGVVPLDDVSVTRRSDPSASTYSLEQWSVTMDQFGNSMDTNMLGSAMALASKFLADSATLGINAGQSINQVARNKLYKGYAGGRTWCTTAGTSDTSIIVQSTNGFEYNSVNGVPVAVSGANPLNVTISYPADPDSSDFPNPSQANECICSLPACVWLTYSNEHAVVFGDIRNR